MGEALYEVSSTRRRICWQVLLTLSLLLLAQAQEEPIPDELLEEAMEAGFRIAGESRGYETILGLQLRGTSELDDASQQLFDFRRPEPQSKVSSVCLGISLLEVSKYLIGRLPGTTVEAVRRLQEQGLKSSTCRRMLSQSGDDCVDVRVENIPRCTPSAPYRTLDGTCNNLRNPKWGSSGTPFSRYLRPFYDDGLDEPRGSARTPSTALPSPRKVSVVMTQGRSDRPKPVLVITRLVSQFGQFLDHDLTHTPESAVRGEGNTLLPFGCCERGVPPSELDRQRVPDCRPIDLTGDPLFERLGRSCMRFVRSLVADKGCKLGPREQLNQVTAFVDGSVLYGTSQFLSNHLRDQRSRGQLKHSIPPGSSPQQGSSCPGSFCNSALLPEQRCHSQTTQSCFISGDGRANEQPGLTSLHILLMRVHNSVAQDLGAVNPHWDGERVFQETRRIVVALQQQVVYREFLPVVLGSGPMDHFNLWLQRDGYFHGYNDTVDPSTPNVFATAAFRFGHSLVDDVIMQVQGFRNITLLDSFNQPSILKQDGTRPSQFLQGITHTSPQSPDEYMVPTLTNNLFGTPSFPVGFDLYALNIMRGRDHGLASYNEWRSACGLPRARTFEHLATLTTPQTANKLRSLYRSVEDLDLFPAALSEPPLGNGILGPTFACLIGQHFHDIKIGDRFWHENLQQPQPFTREQLSELRSVWFASMLCHHTNIAELQPSPFLAAEPNRNPLRSCPSYRKMDLRVWREGFGTIGEPITVPPASQTSRPITLAPAELTRPLPLATTSTPDHHKLTQSPIVPTQAPQVQTRPSPLQTRPPPLQTRPPPVQTRPPVVQTRPPPVQSSPFPLQTSAPPLQTRPPPVQTRPPPVQTRPPPVQTRPPPLQTRPPWSPSPVTPWPPATHPPITGPPTSLPPITWPSVSTRPPISAITPSYPDRPVFPDLNQPQVHPPVFPPHVEIGWPTPPPSGSAPAAPFPPSDRPFVYPSQTSSPRPPEDRPSPGESQPGLSVQYPLSQPSLGPGSRPTTQRPIFQPPPYYPLQQILPPFGKQCRATGVWRRLPGMDTWCTNNCYHIGAVHCPPTHCTCY